MAATIKNWYLRAFIACLSLLLLQACANAPIGNAGGLLWKVERPGNPTSYLFGTIHSDDPRVTEIPKPVASALLASDQFVMEMLIDKDTERKARSSMFLRDGRTLESIIGSERYRQTVSAMTSRGYDEGLVRVMKPWAVFSVLSMPPSQSNEFLDVLLAKRAKQAGKTIFGLESVEEQIAVFDQMEMPLQLDLLADTVQHLDELKPLLDETINIYLERDLEGIVHLNQRTLGYTSTRAAKALDQRLLVERNQRMIKRLLPELRQRGNFVAVGALHLPGPQGLITLLRQEGFTVTSIY